jgi:hypothetical protein
MLLEKRGVSTEDCAIFKRTASAGECSQWSAKEARKTERQTRQKGFQSSNHVDTSTATQKENVVEHSLLL